MLGRWVLARRAAVALVAALLVMSMGTVAHASNFSGASGGTGCNSINMADNASHGFYYSSVTTAMVQATNWNRINNLDPTDINTSVSSTVTELTDVVVYDADYQTYCGIDWHYPGIGGAVGLVTCVSLNSADECEKHEMRFDTSYTAGASVTSHRNLGGTGGCPSDAGRHLAESDRAASPTRDTARPSPRRSRRRTRAGSDSAPAASHDGPWALG